jgi:hypothetical protein
MESITFIDGFPTVEFRCTKLTMFRYVHSEASFCNFGYAVAIRFFSGVPAKANLADKKSWWLLLCKYYTTPSGLYTQATLLPMILVCGLLLFGFSLK